MKRIFLLCITCFCLFFVLPTVAHGENIGTSSESTNSKVDRKSPNVLKKVDTILKDTTKSIELVGQETTDFTKQTGTDLSELVESKPGTSKMEATGNLLNKTIENSVPTLEKTIETVTDTLAVTTSEVTNTVNETVNSVVYELPTIPVVTPVVNEVSKTVQKTTSSVHALVENKKHPNDISKEVNVENSDVVDSEDKIINPPHEIIQNEEKTIIGDGNFDPNPTEQSPVIPSLPAIGTDELVKQDETSNLEEHDEIKIMNDSDNLFVDSKTEESSIDRHTVVKEFSVMEQVEDFENDIIKKKTANNLSHPAESNKKRSILPSAINTVTSPSTASSILSLGGQSDSLSVIIVDAFTLIPPKGRQWIHTDENAMVQWTHAPPGKPPQQSPFFKM